MNFFITKRIKQKKDETYIDYKQFQFQNSDIKGHSTEDVINAEYQKQSNDKNRMIQNQHLNQKDLDQEDQRNQIEIKRAKNNCFKKYWIIFFVFLVCLIALIGLLSYFLTRQKSQPQPQPQKLNGTIYDLVLLDDPSAKCLDGTQAGYYISRGGDPNMFFVYFEGGGWCADNDYSSTLENCYQRSRVSGSSKNYPLYYLQTNFFSVTAEQNIFLNWTKVIFKHCDGTGHQGTKKDPIEYNGSYLYFRGHNITIARFASLEIKNKIFSEATHIIVSGSSAGGFAAYMWTNYVFDNAKKAKILLLPDSGIFLDEMNVQTNQYALKNKFKNMLAFTNEIDPPVPECVQKFNGSIQNCMFAQNLYTYIKVPIFNMQSLYDTWCIYNILGISCVNEKNLTSCNSTQISIMDKYHENTTQMLIEITNTSISNGVWAISCPTHGFLYQTYFSEAYRVPQYSINSARYAVRGWILQNLQNNTIIDKVKWPQNRPCAKI